VVDNATGFIVEITEYEFSNDQFAAGNVLRVKRKIPPGPSRTGQSRGE